MSKIPEANEYASPPCLMHKLDDAGGIADLVRGEKNPDVARWRKIERERLISARLAVDSQLRIEHAEAIARHLGEWIDRAPDLVLGAYWPFRGEPNLHPWLEEFRRRGGRTALPVVKAKGAPLVYRLWAQGARMSRGVWNIPIPADGEEVVPDMMLAPLVGFDRAGYRLGYGGGFFDRTLAAFSHRPKVIGVGYDDAAIETIYPQWHDIPMDLIITESSRKPTSR